MFGKPSFRAAALFSAALLGSASFAAAPTQVSSIAAVGKDGKSLNLGFESGSLQDWKAVGKAFEGQPIKGDTVAKRRADMKSAHTGEYWIGTYEKAGDDAQGTLTSVPFKVTQPWASFLIAGGQHENTRVELVSAETEKVIFKAHGVESEDLRPVIVDLKDQQGKEIFIRVVDQQGGHWGHINFDDFKFHAQKPVFANALDPAAAAAAIPPMDAVAFAGLTGEEAAKAAVGPKGFSMKLFAGEPDVQQPIAFALDHRGRVWVAEAYNYPQRAPEGKEKDRILIFEDTDGDHKFDKRTVFAEKLNLVSGLEVGFGGVWVGAAPYLMFIPDRDGDDKPDGKPEILLDGWAWQDTHETLNTFAWGPDGWLYGCHGVFTHSNVGKPGAKDSDRTRINAGIWRYHPTQHKFEVFAEGTSNPWGIDFDEHGQVFIEACVIPHLFHIIQGARYERQAGQHFNPHIYADIKNIADHVHYAGNKGPHAGNNRSDAAGGGHAHAGLMIYQGDSWPEEYRGKIFMNNIHGQRLNMDIPERVGSGYVGKHGPDFLNFNDKWSQVLNFMSDQDGSAYIIDWYDKNQCHHNNPDGHDRSNGRIFKLVYNDQKTTQVNFEKLSNKELVQLVSHKNEWKSRHARRVLQERGQNQEVHSELRKLAAGQGTTPARLRALWALHVTGGALEADLLKLLGDKDEYIRAWAIQLLSESKNPSDAALEKFATMAKSDSSQFVRLYLAAAMQRTAPEKRFVVLEGLLAHEGDAKDHNLPLMYWYATEGAIAADPKRAPQLLSAAKIPKVREFVARRIVAGSRAVAER
ncbi:MAG TPA: PVC-type heme-binding CxxCH protein [Methylomirabilota bacterium]|nr:PVC-type heme-binding CxxCH protein [Methylomirabilota bacterium]